MTGMVSPLANPRAKYDLTHDRCFKMATTAEERLNVYHETRGLHVSQNLLDANSSHPLNGLFSRYIGFAVL